MSEAQREPAARYRLGIPCVLFVGPASFHLRWSRLSLAEDVNRLRPCFPMVRDGDHVTQFAVLDDATWRKTQRSNKLTFERMPNILTRSAMLCVVDGCTDRTLTRDKRE